MPNLAASTESSPGAPPPRPPGGERALKLVSRFTTVDEFLDSVSTLVDETSLFIVSRKPFPIGKRRFLLQLQGRETMVEGAGEILDAPAPLAGPGSPVGVRLRFLELSEGSVVMHRRLL